MIYKISQNIFFKVFIALVAVGVLPVTISSFLIISIYQEQAYEMVRTFHEDNPERLAEELDLLNYSNEENTLLIYIVITISLIITLFAAVYLSKTFTLPLQQVTKASLLLGRGDLSIRLQTPREDEFGRLAEGFNQMAQALADIQSKLKKANAELENRVAERTAELTFSNNELRKTAEKIHESSRLRSEFLSNMSHELRTPLNAILGYSELLMDGIYGEMNIQQSESMDKIRKNSQMLLRLINDLLDMSRMEAGRMPVHAEPFDPVDLVEQTVSGVRPLFDKKNLDLLVYASTGLPEIRSDRNKVQQVLLNLLSNALKFTESGRVSISVEYDPANNSVAFSVTDTGIGIDNNNIDRIFDQFRQVDGSTARKYGGTGLGLSISKKIATVLDGRITVQSEEGKGSTFTLTVPVSYEEKGIEPTITKTAGGKLIVAIDDDSDVLKVLTDSLESEGYNVVACTDGDMGIRKIKELSPYAVTLDIMMPYRDGWSVLRELKSNPNTKDVPVIIVSIIDDRSRGYQLGVNDYIVKPFKRQDILASLQSLKPESRGQA